MRNFYTRFTNSTIINYPVVSFNSKYNRFLLIFFFILFQFVNSFAQIFENRGGGIEQWDILDLQGDAKIYSTVDETVPPGYGPEVLHIEGKVVLGMAKGNKLSEGTFVVLYRENNPKDYDADGIILVKSNYNLDISKAHNIKEMNSHVWFEQDNDNGIQLKAYDNEGTESILSEISGTGVITDLWNKTDWIWQKINIKGDMLRAKFWSAHKREPKEWLLETEHKSEGERFGFKINSGNINLAYFEADSKDIKVKAPSKYLFAPITRITKPEEINLKLFTNQIGDLDQKINLTIISNDKQISESEFNFNIPDGSNEFNILISTNKESFTDSKFNIYLPTAPEEGFLKLLLADKDGNKLAERIVTILPVNSLLERFAKRREIIKKLWKLLKKSDKKSKEYKVVKVIHDAAKSHLDYSITLFENGDIDASGMSFRFVDEALAELDGYKNAYLNKLDKGNSIKVLPWNEKDTRGIGKSEKGQIDSYSMNYLISFDEPIIYAQSMVMGRTYDLTIPWKVNGITPDKDYNFEVRIVSPLGHRTVAKSIVVPDVKTSKWKPGKRYLQHVKLNIVAEDSTNGKGQPEQPNILDEYHNLLISVSDPETGAKVVLGNLPGDQPERVGESFLAGKYFISSQPLEITNLSLQDGLVRKNRNDSFSIYNIDTSSREIGALFTVSTDAGDEVYHDYKSFNIEACKSIPVNFSWKSTWAGNVELKIELVKNGITLTEVKKKINIALPDNEKIEIIKENHTEKKGNKFFTKLHINCGNGKTDISVFAGSRLVGSGSGNNLISVKAEPWFGYYDVFVQSENYSFTKRIIATVVETSGMDILVNGEPFLIKGVNVHGLNGRSPEKSRSMLRIMRELGFNAWRGDYPPLWQMDLAYELNSFYTVLGPFSCTHTENIFGRQSGPPMTTARELSRLIVERYKNSAGVLMWNSCNEITGEKIDFLNTLLPVYKTLDPYERPVHYSNLYGQDLYQGQDLMGVNYYFGAGQNAKDRQPIIKKSIDIAKQNNIPIMYNEFNSFVGAVHTTGVEAMYEMYEWGIEQRMCGGFQYMKGNSTSHPGIFDSDFNTHKIYNEAIIDVLADVEVTIKSNDYKMGKVMLQIRNKRNFTLREVKLSVSASGIKIEGMDITELQPKAVQDIEIILPQKLRAKVTTLKGYIEFVSHFGFNCKIPISLIVADN